jgi:hypothetical protein
MKKVLWCILLVASAAVPAQSPYSNQLLATFAATGTGTSPPYALGAKGPSGYKSGSWSMANIQVTAVGLSTATFAVLASSDPGCAAGTFVALPLNAVASPTTLAASITTTAAGTWQFSPGAFNCFEIQLTAFTGTSIVFSVTGSPNAVIGRAGAGGGGGPVSVTSPTSSLTITPSPLTGTGTIDINFANANNWTGVQTFTNGFVIPSGGVGTFNSGGFLNANEINGTLLSSLASCLLWNTTSTGVPSCATGAQVASAIAGQAITPLSVTSASDGVHPGFIALPWNSTANAAPTSATGWEGAVAASGTAGWFDLPAALPSVQSLMIFAGVSSAHSVGSMVATLPATMDPPVNIQYPFGAAGNGLAFTFTGQTFGGGFVAPNSGTYGHIAYQVDVADNTTHTYNMGIYNSAGTLLCSSGAIAGTVFAPATGPTSIAMTSNCVLAKGGVYFIAYSPITSGTAQLAAVVGVVPTPFAFAQISASSMPSTVTAPTLSYTISSISNNAMLFSLYP